MLVNPVRYIHFNLLAMKTMTEKTINLDHGELQEIIMTYIRSKNVWLPESPKIKFGITSHNANWAEITFLIEEEGDESK